MARSVTTAPLTDAATDPEDWILPVGVGSNSHVNSSLLTFAELRRANTRSLGSIGETADVVFSFAHPTRCLP